MESLHASVLLASLSAPHNSFSIVTGAPGIAGHAIGLNAVGPPSPFPSQAPTKVRMPSYTHTTFKDHHLSSPQQVLRISKVHFRKPIPSRIAHCKLGTIDVGSLSRTVWADSSVSYGTRNTRLPLSPISSSRDRGQAAVLIAGSHSCVLPPRPRSMATGFWRGYAGR